jgi:hypothetical protein
MSKADNRRGDETRADIEAIAQPSNSQGFLLLQHPD